MNDSITKICPKCKVEKISSDFYIRSNGDFQDCCKSCYNKRGNIYQKVNKKDVNKRAQIRYSKNPEKYKKQCNEWHKAHPGMKSKTNKKYHETHREQDNLRYKIWSKNNPDKVKKKWVKWKNKNIDKMKILHDNWVLKNPNKITEYNNSYRSRKKQVGGNITAQEWEELKNKYNNSCLCCGRNDVKLTLDHVIPLKLGGQNIIENAQPLCKSCNSKKHITIVDYRRY